MGKGERVESGGKVCCSQIWQKIFAGILPAKITLTYFSICHWIDVKLSFLACV